MTTPEQGPRLLTLPRGAHPVCDCGEEALCPTHCPRRAEAPLLRVSRRIERVWLCRCGHSAQWPRCDGSHNRR